MRCARTNFRSPRLNTRSRLKVKDLSLTNSCVHNNSKSAECMTWIAFSDAKGITRGQLPGVRGLRDHLLHTVTFLFFYSNTIYVRNIVLVSGVIKVILLL